MQVVREGGSKPYFHADSRKPKTNDLPPLFVRFVGRVFPSTEAGNDFGRVSGRRKCCGSGAEKGIYRRLSDDPCIIVEAS